MRFVFAVAPHHPLAGQPEPLSDDTDPPAPRGGRGRLRAARRRSRPSACSAGRTCSPCPACRPSWTPSCAAWAPASLPECLAQPYIDSGRLVAKRVERTEPVAHVSYAWRKSSAASPGRALQWWLEQLDSPVTRGALLGGHLGKDK